MKPRIELKRSKRTGNLWAFVNGANVSVFKRDGKYHFSVYRRGTMTYSHNRYDSEEDASNALLSHLETAAGDENLDRAFDRRVSREE